MVPPHQNLWVSSGSDKRPIDGCTENNPWCELFLHDSGLPIGAFQPIGRAAVNDRLSVLSTAGESALPAAARETAERPPSKRLGLRFTAFFAKSWRIFRIRPDCLAMGRAQAW